MKIVVVFDIYGNVLVFEVVFVDLMVEVLDLVVNFGDCVFGLFWFEEIVVILWEIGWLMVCGNYDWFVLENLVEIFGLIDVFVVECLFLDSLIWLKIIQLMIYFIDEICLCYGILDDDDWYLIEKIEGFKGYLLDEFVLLENLVGEYLFIICCGYIYIFWIVWVVIIGQIIVNLGSVGLFFYEDQYFY